MSNTLSPLSQDVLQAVLLYLPLEELRHTVPLISRSFLEASTSDQLWDFLYHRDVPSFSRGLVLLTMLRVKCKHQEALDRRSRGGMKATQSHADRLSVFDLNDPPYQEELRSSFLDKLHYDHTRMSVAEGYNPLSELEDLSPLFQFTADVGSKGAGRVGRGGAGHPPPRPSLIPPLTTTTPVTVTGAAESKKEGDSQGGEVGTTSTLTAQIERRPIVCTANWSPRIFVEETLTTMEDSLGVNELYALLRGFITFQELYRFLLWEGVACRGKVNQVLVELNSSGRALYRVLVSGSGSLRPTSDLQTLDAVLVDRNEGSTLNPMTVLQRQFKLDVEARSRNEGARRMNMFAKNSARRDVRQHPVGEAEELHPREAAAQPTHRQREFDRIGRFVLGHDQSVDLYEKYRSKLTISLLHGSSFRAPLIFSGCQAAVFFYISLILRGERLYIYLITKDDGSGFEARRIKYVSWWRKLGPKWDAYYDWAEQQRCLTLHRNFIKTTDPSSGSEAGAVLTGSANHLRSVPWFSRAQWADFGSSFFPTFHGHLRLPLLTMVTRSLLYPQCYVEAHHHAPYWLLGLNAVSEAVFSATSFTMVTKLFPLLFKAYGSLLTKSLAYISYLWSLLLTVGTLVVFQSQIRRNHSSTNTPKKKVVFWLKHGVRISAVLAFGKIPWKKLLATFSVGVYGRVLARGLLGEAVGGTSSSDLSLRRILLSSKEGGLSEGLGDQTVLFSYLFSGVFFGFVKYSLLPKGRGNVYLDLPPCHLPPTVDGVVGRRVQGGESDCGKVIYTCRSWSAGAGRYITREWKKKLVTCGLLHGVEDVVLTLIATLVLIKEGSFQPALATKVAATVVLSLLSHLIVRVRGASLSKKKSKK